MKEATVLTLGFPQKIAFGSNYQGGNDHSNDNNCNESFLPWGEKDWKWGGGGIKLSVLQ